MSPSESKSDPAMLFHHPEEVGISFGLDRIYLVLEEIKTTRRELRVIYGNEEEPATKKMTAPLEAVIINLNKNQR